MNSIQNSLFEAMNAFRNNAINNSKGTVTIEGTISKVKDAGLGEYYVKYLENDFVAYAGSNVTYSVGDNVYILVPEGDFTKTKIILGMTSPTAGVFITDNSDTSTHFRVSDNFITYINDIIKMSSYEETRINNIDIYDISSVNELNTYAEEGHRTYELNFLVKTSLIAEQQSGGNYGVTLKVPVEIPAAAGQGVTDVVWKNYTLDVGNMLGNPYRFEEWTPQSLYFTLDENYRISTDFVPTISYFCYDFQTDATKTDIKDIWIKDIGLYVADELSAQDVDGYCLKIKASEGNYFTENSHDIKTLSLVLKVNGKDTNIYADNAEAYWFIEDASIKLTSNANYCNYGGLGWRCLNAKTNVVVNPDGTTSWDWINNLFTQEIEADEYDSVVNIKCVLVYNGQQISDIITIKNLMAEVNLTLSSSTGTTVFLKDTGYVYLTARWRSYCNNVTELQEIINTIRFEWLRYDKNGKVISDTDNFFEVIKYNEIEEPNYLITEIRFPVNAVDELNRVVCSVKENGRPDDFEGTASIVITTSADLSYNLIINNDEIIYKYDSNGDSPAGTAYDGPATSKITSIAPLTYTIRKIDGSELTKEEYCYVKYKWIVPKNSLFEVRNATREDEVNYYFEGYDNLNHNINLPYDIANRYNLAAAHGTIRLEVEYQGNQLSATASINFIKEGQSGSNGTQFAARLVFGGDTPSTSVPYGTLDNRGILQKIKVCYETTTNKLYRYVDNTFITLDKKRIFTRVWRDSEELVYSRDFEVEYSMFDFKVCNPFLDVSNINDLGGVYLRRNAEYDTERESINIVQAKIKVFKANESVSNSEEIIYAYYPIEFIYTPYITKFIPSLDGGFAEVMYHSDGTSPEWDETAPFKINANGFAFNDLEGNLSDFFTTNWSSQHHLEIEDISEDGLEVQVKPNNKYDDGNSCNFVKVQLDLKPDVIEDINERIDELNIEITSAEREIVNIDQNKDTLDFFASSYIPDNWLSEIETIKPFLEAKYSYYNSLANILQGFINDFLNFLSNRTEDFTTLLNQINALQYHVYNLKVSLTEMHATPGSNYHDLYELSEYKIPWSDEIKNDYIAEYGSALALQLEMLIENVNNQIDVCDRLVNELVDTEYFIIDDDSDIPSEDLSDEDLQLLTDEDAETLASDPRRSGSSLTDEDLQLLTDEDLEQLTSDPLRKTGVLTDETEDILMDDDEESPLLEDLVQRNNYLTIYKRLYLKVSQIFDIDFNHLYPSFQTCLEQAVNYIQRIFENGSYIELKNLFDNTYDNYLKGVFDYNKGVKLLKVSNAVNAKFASSKADEQTKIVDCENEIYNLTCIADEDNISITYIRPIVLYFNRYEMSNLNAWDGNKIETGDGTYLLAPQVGAGIKEEDNSFTGIVMGQRNLTSVARSLDDTQVGLFGYNQGKMSLFLNARKGSAIFGEAGVGGQIIIDPESGSGMIYSGNFWTNYDSNTLLPASYDSSNQSGKGMLIDFTKGVLRSGKHDALQSEENGFFLNEKGLSIGSQFYVDKDGTMRIGHGAVEGAEHGHYWTVGRREDATSEDGYHSYIAFDGNERFDPERVGQLSWARVYIGTDGISIGNNFTVDKDGNLRIGGGSIGGDTVGGWYIYDDFLASANYYDTDGNGGIKLDSRNNLIHLGDSESKIYSGQHDEVGSSAAGFYLGDNGFSIGELFSVNEYGQVSIGNDHFQMDADGRVRIGNSYDNIQIDGYNGKIYSGSHTTYSSTANGFYLSRDGLSFGNNFKVETDGDAIMHFVNSSGKIYSGSHTNFSSTVDGFYLGQDGLSIGNSFSVDDSGYFKLTGSGNASNRIEIDGTRNIIYLGSSNAKIYSGNHTSFSSTADGFYLSGNGLSIGSMFSVDEKGVLKCKEGYIGNSKIVTYGSADDGSYTIDHSSSAWKLRSAYSANKELVDYDDFLLADGATKQFLLPVLSSNMYYVFAYIQRYEETINPETHVVTSSWILVNSDDYTVYDNREAGTTSYVEFNTAPAAGTRYRSCYKMRAYLSLTNDCNFVGSYSKSAAHGRSNDITPKLDIGTTNYSFRAGFFKRLSPGQINSKESRVGNTDNPFDLGSFNNLYVNGKQMLNKVIVVTLDKDNWTESGGHEQIVEIPEIQPNMSTQLVYVAPCEDSIDNYLTCQIFAVNTGEGSLTFRCGGTPIMDIDVYVTIQNAIVPKEEVHIYPEPEKNKNYIQLFTGETLVLQAYAIPSFYHWEVDHWFFADDEQTCGIIIPEDYNQDSLPITPYESGQTEICVQMESDGHPSRSGYCDIRVYDFNNLVLYPSSLVAVHVGEQADTPFTARAYSINDDYVKEIHNFAVITETIESDSETSIASINDNGTLIGLAPGTGRVEAAFYIGETRYEASCPIEVLE